MDRRRFLGALGWGGLALGACWVPGGCWDEGGSESERFTLVVLPDTQEYAKSYPAVFEAQTRWIVENRQRENIVFVSHLGDVVDNAPNLDQWTNAKSAMARLDRAGLPYGVALGNHDLRYEDAHYRFPPGVDHSCAAATEQMDCTATNFLAHFGPEHFSGAPWYGGASPSGRSSYQRIEVSGLGLIFLHLCLDAPRSELAWAQQLVQAHPSELVHLSTHRYLYDFRGTEEMPGLLKLLAGGRFNGVINTYIEPLYFDDGLSGDGIFETLVRPNSNVFMVHCGHVDAEYRQQSRNDAGLEVHEIRSGPRFSDHGLS